MVQLGGHSFQDLKVGCVPTVDMVSKQQVSKQKIVIIKRNII